MTLKNKGTSITKRLSNLANKLGLAYQSIATSFLIERLVARLTLDDKLSKSLVFKGGYVGLRVYDSTRFTVDLDALLTKSNLQATLRSTKEAAEKDIGDSVWFKFESEIDLKTQGEYGGIRQIFRTGIGEPLSDIKRAQILNFDLGIGDPVTPMPLNKKTTELIGEGELSWLVYPIETIIAEKLHALIERGEANSRSKDIYDLYQFLPKANSKILKDALLNCFEFRKTNLPNNLSLFLKQISLKLLKQGWPSATSTVKHAPTFEEAFNLVVILIQDFEKEK